MSSNGRSPHGALIRLEHAEKVFRMGEVEVCALRDLTLEVLEGELLVIVGPSGSGKTTLLNLIGGLDRATSGTVRFRDRDLATLDRRELGVYRREELGFVFQFFNLIPNLTARENVMDVDEALRLVGLGERADHFPAQLSGGEQQRVAIARALAKNPAVLLCDEPTGALDYDTGKRVLGLLHDVNRRLGKTVVLITHNLAISRMADRLVRMRSGEVVELKTNPEPAGPDDISW
jgi:putative ABC transport system ATP-binding protein